MTEETKKVLIELAAVLLIPVAIIAVLVALTGCGRNQRDGCTVTATEVVCRDGTRTPLATPGQDGSNGTNGSSCSVSQVETGALISCTDGTEVEVFNGQDGADGHSVTIVCTKKGGDHEDDDHTTCTTL
jgi:hypothetical protein